MTRRTIRVRLTALYSGLFLATSTILLVVVNLLLRGMLQHRVSVIENGSPPPYPLPSLAQSERGIDNREPVALDTLVRQTAGEVPSDGVTMTLNSDPATVSGDPVLLSRLAANLLHNAVRYNRPGGTVHVTVSAAGAFAVRNTGPEVPEDRIGELFEPFRRLPTARTRSTDGAGLGLSIVAAITRAHDASITARPNPGGGLEVTVCFPSCG